MLQRITEIQPALPLYEPGPGARAYRPEGVTLAEIFRILKRRLWIIVACAMLFAVVAGIFIVVTRPLYTATATVLIDPRRTNAAQLDPNQNVQAPATDDATIESQVLLIQSIAVLRRVVTTLDLVEDPDFKAEPGLLDPVKKLMSKSAPRAPVADAATMGAVEILQKRLKVTRQRNSFLVDINVTIHDPERAAQVANAVANAYFMELIRSKSDATKTAAGWLNGQLDDLRSRLLTSDRAVAEFRGSHSLTMSQGATVNDQQVTDLNSKLIDARAEAAEARAKYEQVAEIAKNKSDPGSLGEALSSETIGRLRGQYAELVKSEADFSSKYGPQHPLLIGVKAQLRDTQKLINAEVERILLGRKHIYEVAAARVTSLQASLNGLQNVSGQSGQDQVKLSELQREADANRTLYESFLGRFKEAAARESLDLPEARIVTSANAPLQPSFPKALLFLVVAVPLGAAFGALLAIGIDRFDRRVKKLEQLEAITGLPAITAIPLVGLRELSRITKRGSRALAAHKPNSKKILPLPLQPPLMRYIVDEPGSVFAEAVRAVRLSMRRAARIRRMRTVMITSAVEGDGKTTLAANLALSHAIMGVRTLLIEGDLRNPQMTKSLCPNVELGLFDVALGRASLQQTILVDSTTNLAVLPSPPGDEFESMGEFLFSDGLSIILNELQRHYEVIIIDSPPLLPFVDSRQLAEYADGIVMAVRWNRTPEDVVTRALGLLAPFHDRILGTVLTQVDLSRLRHYDYYQSSAYIKPYNYQMNARPEART